MVPESAGLSGIGFVSEITCDNVFSFSSLYESPLKELISGYLLPYDPPDSCSYFLKDIGYLKYMSDKKFGMFYRNQFRIGKTNRHYFHRRALVSKSGFLARKGRKLKRGK